MNDLFLKSRGETILSSFDQMAEPNQNLKPVLYQHELAYWLSYFSGKSVTQYSTWKYLYLNQLVIAIVSGCNSFFNPFT